MAHLRFCIKNLFPWTFLEEKKVGINEKTFLVIFAVSYLYDVDIRLAHVIKSCAITVRNGKVTEGFGAVGRRAHFRFFVVNLLRFVIVFLVMVLMVVVLVWVVVLFVWKRVS